MYAWEEIFGENRGTLETFIYKNDMLSADHCYVEENYCGYSVLLFLHQFRLSSPQLSTTANILQDWTRTSSQMRIQF